MARVVTALGLVYLFLLQNFFQFFFISPQNLNTTKWTKNNEVDAIESQFQRTSFHKRIFYQDSNQGKNHLGYNELATHASIRVSFQLHDPAIVAMTNIFNHHMSCKEDFIKWHRAAVPNSLLRIDDRHGHSRSGRVLEFTTTIVTSLKIMLIGDSVLVQFSELLDEMLGGLELKSRKVLWHAWKDHSGSTIVAPTRGGGVSALLRMTGLLSLSNKGKRPANYHDCNLFLYDCGYDSDK